METTKEQLKLLFSILPADKKISTRMEAVGMIAGIVADRDDSKVPKEDKLSWDDIITITKNRLAFDIAKECYSTRGKGSGSTFPKLLEAGEAEGKRILKFRKGVDEDFIELEHFQDIKF